MMIFIEMNQAVKGRLLLVIGFIPCGEGALRDDSFGSFS